MILKLKNKTIVLPRSILIPLAILYAATTLLYSALWMIDARVQPSAVELGFGTDFIPSEKVQTVTNVYNGSPAMQAGLRPGDKIILLNGNIIEDEFYLTSLWKKHNPGDTVSLSVIRPGVKETLNLKGVFRLRESLKSEGNLEYVASEVRNSFPIPFVIVGLAVLFLRIEDPIAWLLAFLFGSFISTPGFANRLSIAPSLTFFIAGYQAILISMLAPLFYFFFSVFPVRSPIDRQLPWLKWLAIFIGLSFTITGFKFGKSLLPPPFHSIAGEILSSKIVFIFLLLFLVLGMAALGLNFFYAENSEVRRKIRVILWGSAFGVIPSILQAAIREFTGYQSSNLMTTLLVVLLFIFPLSFAYAVVKHRVLEIPVLLKRSARYLLVQRGFTILLGLISIGLVLLFAMSVSNYLQSFTLITQPIVIAIGTGFGVALLWGGTKIHNHVSGSIDKAFFRSVYDAKLILEKLANQSAETTDRRELAQLLDHSITEALHPGFLIIYFQKNENILEAVSGIVPEQLTLISLEEPLLELAAKSRKPFEIPLTPVNERGEKILFASLKPEYIVPMLGRGGRLTGLLVLGSRLSEEAYSIEDRSLLSSVATQAATALENIRLAEEIAEKIESQRKVVQEMEIEQRLLEADNSRKTKELEDARALQLSMLPKDLPVVPNLDIAVFMKTATEIGGDYYDFDLAPDGTLTVAMGDATGHGTKAGMMVVIAKNNFTAFSQLPDLLDIFEKMTHSIKRLNLHSMFISMMLMRFKNNSAVFSSAGMPYPLIYRAATNSIEEVALKGMPLGAFSKFPYEQKEFTLAPGDTILLMSDGYTELFNDKEEILDFSRVKKIFQDAGNKSPQDIIDYLLQQGETWANGTPQVDDITFIVLKVKK